MNLQLSLKTKWFEMTKSGVKHEDYRDITSYWASRLLQRHKEYSFTELFSECSMKEILYCLGHCTQKEFSQNTMTLGYPKKGDTERILILEHAGIEIRTGNTAWGAEEGKTYFVIKHGDEKNT